jgi:hypothetical protein
MEVVPPDDPALPHINEIATFLVATAMVLRETVMRFEKTTNRITEKMLTRAADNIDRDLVMTIQDFDRLHQEFATLAEVLIQAAAKSGKSWLREEGGLHPAADALATVSVADLKERLMQRLGTSILDLTGDPGAEEAVF